MILRDDVNEKITARLLSLRVGETIIDKPCGTDRRVKAVQPMVIRRYKGTYVRRIRFD